MSDDLQTTNAALREHRPAWFEALSELGRGAFYPPDIPFQAAQARGAELNATIGQITDGEGGIQALPAIAEQLGSLGESHLNESLLYSPVEGAAELRRLWARRHRPAAAPGSSLPLVTVGLTEGLSLAGDLFCDRDTPVVIPSPFWGNYRQIFGLRRGARVVEVAAFVDAAFQPSAIVDAVLAEPGSGPVVVVLNFPSNPCGYSPSPAERSVLCAGLVEAAAQRPVVVICDDAYAGLVFEEAVPGESIFWSLVGRHRNLVPLKVDGVTKELVLFGGRVGFLTFGCDRDSPEALALESKVKGLLRATVGSPVAISQQLVMAALQAPGLEQEIALVRSVLERRYRCLKAALAAGDAELLRPLPFNSGCFALVELPPDLDADAVRLELLSSWGTGVIAVGSRYVRIAFCSVKESAIPELVARVEGCVRKMSAGA